MKAIEQNHHVVHLSHVHHLVVHEEMILMVALLAPLFLVAEASGDHAVAHLAQVLADAVARAAQVVDEVVVRTSAHTSTLLAL
jgi:hypothetical protein